MSDHSKNHVGNIWNRVWKRKGFLLFLVFLSIAVIVLSLFQGSGDRGATVSYRVQRVDLGEELRLGGTIDAERRVDLGFARGGRISRVFKSEGDSVEKGETIALVDQSQVYANYLRSRVQYTRTQTEVAREADDLETQYEKVKREQDELVRSLREQYLSSELEAVLLGESELTSEIPKPVLSGNYSGMEEGVYRLRVYRSKSRSGYSFELSGLEHGFYPVEFYQPGKLGERGLYIQFSPIRDLSRYRDTVWEIRIPNTRSPHYLERKSAYERALRERDRILSTFRIKRDSFLGEKYGKSIADAQLEEKEQYLRSQRALLADGKITAPFSGTIVKSSLELGKIVAPLEPLVTLFGNEGMKLVLDVPEVYVNRIREGDHVRIVLDAYPDHEYEGVVERIDPVETLVEGSPVYETDVRILEPDSFIRAGMSATAYLNRNIATSVLSVPKHYLIERDGSTFVLVERGGELMAKEVQTGREGRDGFVEITSGISEGDEIVLPNTKRS